LPERRPRLLSHASEALRRRLEAIRSALLIETAPAESQSTDELLGDAPTAAFAGALLGCLTTEWFGASGIAPGIASAAATALLCGALLVTRTTGLFAAAFFPALYGGAFAGMTPIVWLSNSTTGALSVALSIVCGLVFYVVAKLDGRSSTPIGTGCGGRLGAIALVASFLFVELVRPLGADTSRFHAVASGAFDLEPRLAIRGFLACLAGIFGTFLALRRRRIADGGAPVRIFIASAAALAGLMVLHFGDPDDASAMDAFYAGCFAGMSTRDRLAGWFRPAASALVLMILLVPVRAYLNGFGGGLGLAAFVAVVLLIAASRATAWITGDGLSANRRFATAVASATIAVCLLLGAISAELVGEDAPISVAATAPEPATESSDAGSVRLVVDRPAPAAADHPIPVGISLTNAAADDVVVLSGLPSGSTMTNGRPSPTGDWHLVASELADVAIRPAEGFVGGANITVELRRPDRSIIDRQELHLEWVGPAASGATTAVTAPPVAEASTGPSADVVMEDEEELFREFLQSRGHATPEIRGVARPVRTAVRGQQVRGQAAASTGGPRLSIFPLAGGAVRPPRPVVRRADVGDRQKKPPLSVPRRDRPTAVSVSP